MISCDTNILFPACDSTSPQYVDARAFLAAHAQSDSFCLCEQVLMELYCLLRNPAVCRNPLSASDATQTIQGFRSNPHWRVVDVVLGANIMDPVWLKATETGFAYRRIFDVQLGMTLRHHGVTELATRNKKDFSGLGFQHVWDPLAS